MLKPSHINYIYLIYGLIFLAMSIIPAGKARRVTSPTIKNIFWSFTAFSTTKALSIFSGLSIKLISSDEMLSVNNVFALIIINPLAIISSVISSVFLLHFGISILTYKTSIRINYKVFSILLFLVYMTLYFSGIIDLHSAERISRYSFGFNGAFLSSIGCFNLFKTKVNSEEKGLPSGLIICGIAFFLYALTEGIITNPISGIPIELLRLFTAIVLFISSFFVVDLLKEERYDRIGFI